MGPANWLGLLCHTYKDLRGIPVRINNMNPLSVLLGLGMVAVICGTASDEFINQVLERHNYFRSLHGVPKVTVNSTISAYAQAWATYLTSNKVFAHNPDASANGYGENLSWSSNSAKTGTEHTSNLYTNEANYYAQHQFCGGEPNMALFGHYGHYTQIVWKASTQIGVGKSAGTVVINYSPPGNYFGLFTENVPCLTSSSS